MHYYDYGYFGTGTIITYYVIPMNIKELAICEVLRCSNNTCNRRDIIVINFPGLVTHCIVALVRSSCLSEDVVCNLKVMWLSRKRDCNACHVRLAVRNLATKAEPDVQPPAGYFERDYDVTSRKAVAVWGRPLVKPATGGKAT